MPRNRPLGLSATAFLLAAASCTATPTAPAASAGTLPPPLIAQSKCGVVSTWPEQPMVLTWQPVATASTYTIEIDCMNCGTGPDAWVSQGGTPWHLRSGLTAPAYTAEVVTTLRREGGRAMRWRVWAVDATAHEGAKTDWCVTSFSTDGKPTPGGGSGATSTPVVSQE